MKAKIVEPYNKIVARTAQLARLQVGPHLSFLCNFSSFCLYKGIDFKRMNSEEVREYEKERKYSSALNEDVQCKKYKSKLLFK